VAKGENQAITNSFIIVKSISWLEGGNMVSLEIEKPSTWSIGKKLGILAIIFLLVGPFLPYVVTEYKVGDTVEGTEEDSYFNFEWAGLWMLLPLISAILIALILYIKSEIYLVQDEKQVQIKPFIFMMWGFWFFISYLADAVRIGDSQDYGEFSWSQYAGIGLWMIVLGFFLMMLIGFLEWRYPSAAGPGVPKVSLPMRKKEKPAVEVSSEPTTDVAVQPEPQEGVSVTTVKEAPSEGVTVQPEPVTTAAPSVTDKVDMLTREPTSEEEKNLLRWARHINEDGQTFEQCMKCNNYVFIIAKDAGASIVFECPDCGEKFELKK
jgi:hypothetical protein